MLSIQGWARSVVSATLVTGVMLSVSAASANGFDPVLVEQPFAAGGTSYLSAGPSSGYENADSFSLPQASTVTTISWWGTAAGNSGWVIRLASTAEDLAAPPLTGTIVDIVATGSSDAGDAATNPATSPRAIFRFDFLLSTSLGLAVGEHFLSIGNESTDWFWTKGTGGPDQNPVSLFAANYDQLGNPEWRQGDDDLSFQIRGQFVTVPEPGTLALLGLAGVGAAMAGRRRKSACA